MYKKELRCIKNGFLGYSNDFYLVYDPFVSLVEVSFELFANHMKTGDKPDCRFPAKK